MGYLAYALYTISDGAARIQVYYPLEKTADFAYSYGLLGWIPENRLVVRPGADALSFLYAMEGEGVCYIHQPSLEEWPSQEAEIFQHLWILQQTKLTVGQQDRRNRFLNRGKAPLFGAFSRQGWDGEVILAAGGPSLDANLEWIRNRNKNVRLICVGTVLKKLLDQGIRPDLAVVLDGQRRVLAQIEGLEGEDVPLLVALSAHYGFLESYQGPRYLAVTTEEDRQSLGEAAVEEPVLEAGGTVSCLALSATCALGARRIYLAGLDLSFPGGQSHAAGTRDRVQFSSKTSVQGEAVDGGLVNTSRVFLAYKGQIEGILADHPQVEAVNLSRHGLRIQGTVPPDGF